MKFKNGMFGACLVVVTLLTTVLAGYVLSIERDEVTTTGYEYVTDISGLFDYSNAPEYVDYNPSTNYTGYTKDNVVGGTVVYSEASMANQYRFIKDPGTTTTVNASLSYSDTFTSHIDGENTSNNVSSYRVGKWTGTTYNFGSAGAVSIPPTTYNDSNWVADNINNNTPRANVITLTTLINKWVSNNNLSNYASLDINLTYGDAPVMFYAGSWTSSIIYVGVPATQVNVKYATLNENNCLPTNLIVNLVSMTATGSRGSTEIFNTSTDNVAVIYDYDWNNTGTMSQANASVTASISATTAPTYGYMDPTYGVTGVRGGILHWSNNYQNDSITIKVVGDPYERLIISANTTGANNEIAQYSGIALYWASDGDAWVWYKDGPNSSDSNYRVSLGAWPAVQVTINGSTGNVIFTPTSDTNLMSVVDISSNSFIVEDQFNAEEITSLTFETGGAYYPTWQITNTTVFLNTYNTVMYDPSFKVSDYFNYNEWRVNIYAFATYGDSMTVNGQTMIVDRSNATVTFTDGAGVQRTAKLNNLYITREYVDGARHIILTFVGVGSYDLGATVDETISFNGLWYFTSAIYSGYETTQTVYNWDLDGNFHANAGQCLVIFLGIIGAGVVFARAFAGVKIQVLDWVIIAFAVFGALVYIGGLV